MKDSYIKFDDRFCEVEGYEVFKEKLEGSWIELDGWTWNNKITLSSFGIEYQVKGKSIEIDGQFIDESGSHTFFRGGEKVKKVSKYKVTGKFGFVELLFIKLGNLVIRVRQPENFVVSLDRLY